MDGSLDSGAKTVVATDLSQTGAIGTGTDELLEADKIDALTGKYNTTDVTVGSKLAVGDVLKFDFQVRDTSCNEQSITVEFEVGVDMKTLTDTATGKVYKAAGTGNIADTDIATALADALQKDETIGSNFKVSTSANGKGVTFDARTEGAGMEIRSAGYVARDAKGNVAASYTSVSKFGVDTTAGNIIKGADESNSLDISQVKIWDGKDKTLDECTFEIGGKTFVFVD